MHRKLKLYLETSVISLYFQEDAPYLRDLTRMFWREILPDYEIYISEITFDELMMIRNTELKQKVGSLIKDFVVLERTEDIDKLTELYLSLRKIPRGNALQDIHFYRYLKEIEQQEMTPQERIKDDKERAYRARKELGLEK